MDWINNVLKNVVDQERLTASDIAMLLLFGVVAGIGLVAFDIYSNVK